jgi:hypothetical protein
MREEAEVANDFDNSIRMRIRPTVEVGWLLAELDGERRSLASSATRFGDGPALGDPRVVRVSKGLSETVSGSLA